MFRDKHILIIDDSEAILMVIKSMLARLGFERITTATSADKALEIVSIAPDDIFMVLTDLRMPGKDGLDVLRLLGEIQYSGAVAIISEMDKRIINLAADIAKNHHLHLIGCISKPIQQDDLAALIKKASGMLNRHADHPDVLSESSVRQAFKNHWFVPYFQPKVNFATMQVESVEALARIVMPGEVNAVLPFQFLPTVIDAGLQDMMTSHILEIAASNFNKIKSIFGDSVKLGLNLSPEELENQLLAANIEKTWHRYGHRNEELILELTEEKAIQNNLQLECLNRFRLKDFGLSLDDFGTGFTNINQLRNLPYTEVKIDRSLIINIQRDCFCQAILTSLADIAEQLNIHLVAEGVEHIAELNFLIQKYPNLILQGYLVTKPRPLETLDAWYRSWQNQFGTATRTQASR